MTSSPDIVIDVEGLSKSFGGREVVHIDDDLGRRHLAASFVSATVTGCPTRNLSGASGRASIK